MTAIPLITTTVRTGHNPGDTFIGVGLQHLFEQALGPQRWLLIDRFSARGFKEHESAVRIAPFLVYGGMPQYNNYSRWMYWYDRDLWRDFVAKWRLRVFTMAGGAGFSHADITVEDYVADCMRSSKTRKIIRERVPWSLCTTVRDPYAHALLNALSIPNHHLPCSATWATRHWNIQPSHHRPYVFVVPAPLRFATRRGGGRLHGAARKGEATALAWGAVYRALVDAGYQARVVCHAYDEYLAFRRTVPDDDLWYHGDAFTLLREYASAHTVVSARLHASLPAFGLVGTRVLNVSVDVRGSAVSLLPKIANLVMRTPDPAQVLEAMPKLEPSTPEDLWDWEDAYIRVIRDALPHT
ncbi:polysaccharide pyruvyl transferase family protein [Candidatus Poribacteria bacterium]|nr:polysaccharide pyruvyl transferase family protein [Candidatus Poribacteria bacterium]